MRFLSGVRGWYCVSRGLAVPAMVDAVEQWTDVLARAPALHWRPLGAALSWPKPCVCLFSPTSPPHPIGWLPPPGSRVPLTIQEPSGSGCSRRQTLRTKPLQSLLRQHARDCALGKKIIKQQRDNKAVFMFLFTVISLTFCTRDMDHGFPVFRLEPAVTWQQWEVDKSVPRLFVSNRLCCIE